MRIYDVGNTSGSGFWCVASDEERAIELALKMRHIKKASSARVHDVTESMLEHDDTDDLQYFLDHEFEGRLSKCIATQSFDQVLGQLMTGVREERPKSRWQLSGPDGARDAYGNVADHAYELPGLEVTG